MWLTLDSESTSKDSYFFARWGGGPSTYGGHPYEGIQLRNRKSIDYKIESIAVIIAWHLLIRLEDLLAIAKFAECSASGRLGEGAVLWDPSQDGHDEVEGASQQARM